MPITPSLTGLPPEQLQPICKHLDERSKGMLRVTCKAMFIKIGPRTHWSLKIIPALGRRSLKIFAQQVTAIFGLEIQYLKGSVTDINKSLVFLSKKHPNLVSIKIQKSSSNDSTLSQLLSLPNIRIIHLEKCAIKGNDLSVPDKVQQLEELSLQSSFLTHRGFFNICSNINTDSLSVLDLTYITFVNASTYTCTFSGLKLLRLKTFGGDVDNAIVDLLNRIGPSLMELEISCKVATLSNIEDMTCSFPKLKLMRLNCPALTDLGLVRLCNRIGLQLEQLVLRSNAVTLSNIEDMTCSFPKLKLMELICPALTDFGLVRLCNKVGQQLEDLGIQSKVTLSDIVELTCSFPKLKLMKLSCPALTDLGLVGLCNRIGQQLEQLALRCNAVTLSNIEDMTCSFPKLKMMFMSCPALTDLELVGLCNRIGHHLEELSIFFSDKVTLSNIEDMTCSFPNLKLIRLRCPALTDLGLVGLCNRIGQHLEELSIFSDKVTLSNIEDMTCSFPKLKLLELSCPALTDLGLVGLCNRIGQQLEDLRLFQCEIVALSNIEDMTCSFPRLKLMWLLCPAITDIGLAGLCNKVGQQLEELKIMSNVTLNNLEDMTCFFPMLEVLEIRDSNISATNLIAFIRKICINLERLVFDQEIELATLQVEFPRLALKQM